MKTVLWLLFVQGALGAFDTLYYHEWRARLVAGGTSTRLELKLHAARDFIYATLFATLPWVIWGGLWVGALSALLLAEIVITLADFVVEDRARKVLGGVYPGERVTHALMGIAYGAMLANLIPLLIDWASRPTALVVSARDSAEPVSWLLLAMALGVFLSGTRDTLAVFGIGSWPWRSR